MDDGGQGKGQCAVAMGRGQEKEVFCVSSSGKSLSWLIPPMGECNLEASFMRTV